MNAVEFKKALETSPDLPLNEVMNILNDYHISAQMNNLETEPKASLYYYIGCKFKYINIDGEKLLIAHTGIDYSLVFVPFNRENSFIEHLLKLCYDVGIEYSLNTIDEKRYKIRSTYYNSYMSTFVYEKKAMLDYFNTCSRSTRKNINRFDKAYTMSVYRFNEVTEDIIKDIEELNDTWFIEHKNKVAEFEFQLHNTEACLRHELINSIKGALITYRDTDNNLVAYDYFEVWGNVVYALGGKCVTEESGFKSVNRNVMQIADELYGVDFMDIGWANEYSRKKTPIGNETHSNIKGSLPHKTSLVKLLYGSHKRWGSVDTGNITELF